jgi:hypothetical protein
MRIVRIALLFVLALPLFAEHPLAGSYTLDRANSDDVNVAIDSAVRKMNVVTRSIARRRLRRTNPPYAHIALAFDADRARVTAGGATLTLPLNGAPVHWHRDGEALTVTGRMEGPTFVETLTAKDGRRTNTFSRAGDHLVLRVTVSSPRLPSPLAYTLRYR